jgi:hypothetical protein
VRTAHTQHAETKKQWSRDDPAFMVLLFALLCGSWSGVCASGEWLMSKEGQCTVSAAGFIIAFGMGFLDYVELLLWFIFVDFVGFGLVFSGLMW